MLSKKYLFSNPREDLLLEKRDFQPLQPILEKPARQKNYKYRDGNAVQPICAIKSETADKVESRQKGQKRKYN